MSIEHETVDHEETNPAVIYHGMKRGKQYGAVFADEACDKIVGYGSEDGRFVPVKVANRLIHAGHLEEVMYGLWVRVADGGER